MKGLKDSERILRLEAIVKRQDDTIRTFAKAIQDMHAALARDERYLMGALNVLNKHGVHLSEIREAMAATAAAGDIRVMLGEITQADLEAEIAAAAVAAEPQPDEPVESEA